MYQSSQNHCIINNLKLKIIKKNPMNQQYKLKNYCQKIIKAIKKNYKKKKHKNYLKKKRKA